MVSVIITTHNRPLETLMRAVESVMNQTYSDWELIIIDDSTEQEKPEEGMRKREYVDSLRSKGIHITYQKNEKNVGACISRNFGINMAQGKYIAFLDDDDEFEKEKLEKMVAFFELNECDNLAMVYCAYIQINDDTQEIRKYRPYHGSFSDTFEQLMVRGNFIGSTSFPLIKTECLRAVGGFDASMLASQDYELWIRIAQKYKIRYLDEFLCKYHIKGGIDRISTNYEKKIISRELVMKKNKNYYAGNKRAYNNILLHLSSDYLYSGRKKEGFVIWIRAVCSYPYNVKGNMRGMGRILKYIFA